MTKRKQAKIDWLAKAIDGLPAAPRGTVADSAVFKLLEDLESVIANSIKMAGLISNPYMLAHMPMKKMNAGARADRKERLQRMHSYLPPAVIGYATSTSTRQQTETARSALRALNAFSQASGTLCEGNMRLSAVLFYRLGAAVMELSARVARLPAVNARKGKSALREATERAYSGLQASGNRAPLAKQVMAELASYDVTLANDRLTWKDHGRRRSTKDSTWVTHYYGPVKKALSSRSKP